MVRKCLSVDLAINVVGHKSLADRKGWTFPPEWNWMYLNMEIFMKIQYDILAREPVSTYQSSKCIAAYQQVQGKLSSLYCRMHITCRRSHFSSRRLSRIQTISIYSLIPWRCRSLKTRVYQPTVSVMSACPQTEVNNYPAKLGMTCGVVSF